MKSFTFEESNLIAIYSTTNRIEVLQGLTEALSYVTNTDMIELINQTVKKLKIISDEEFINLKIRAMLL